MRAFAARFNRRQFVVQKTRHRLRRFIKQTTVVVSPGHLYGKDPIAILTLPEKLGFVQGIIRNASPEERMSDAELTINLRHVTTLTKTVRNVA